MGSLWFSSFRLAHSGFSKRFCEANGGFSKQMIYSWKLESKFHNLGFEFIQIGFKLKEIYLIEVGAEHPSNATGSPFENDFI